MSAKRFLKVTGVVLFGMWMAGGLMAEPQSSLISTTFSQDLMVDFSNRFYELHPDIPSDDRVLSYVNRTAIEKIPTRAVSAQYDMGIIQSILGRTIVKVRLMDSQEREIETRQVVFHADAKRPTLRATRRLVRGQRIAASDVVIRKEALYGQPQGVVRELEDVIGRETTLSVSPGALFIYSMVTTPALIKARQSVEVIIQKKTITLKVDGIAQQDGRRGDEIRVKLSTGQQNVIRGEVIDDKTVLMLGRY